jgi:3-hydroxyanthranilate 3,4-dioxygenase
MRKDFHYNETEELFYQLEGSIKVIVQEDGQRKSNYIPVTLTSGKMPHSPVRSDASMGLVIERKKLEKFYRRLTGLIATINYMRYILN